MPMLLRKVRGTIARFGMLRGGEGVVVAVSGGVDSMVLLHLLLRLRDPLGLALHVVHLDHGLRGEEGERDAEFVRQEALRLGLGATIGKVEVRARRGTSLQEAARRVRYQFLERVAEEVGASRIALGHTQDDLAETVLINLLRGSGGRGLAGIPPVREGRIIRPLIEVSREEILAYAETHGVPFVVDSSNLKEGYLRNKIRLKLLPALAEYNPKIIRTLAHAALVLREEDAYLSTLAWEALASILTRREEGKVTLFIPKLKALPVALRRRVLREAFGLLQEGLSLSWENMADLEELLERSPSGRLCLPRGLVAFREGETLTFARPPESEGRQGQTLAVPAVGEVVLPPFGLRLHIERLPKEACDLKRGGPFLAFLDAEAARDPLTVRAWRPGDRFFPLGVGGSKKLQDFFVDAKVPRWRRTFVPLLLSGDRIAWVVGFRIDERFKVTERSHQVLKVEAFPL